VGLNGSGSCMLNWWQALLTGRTVVPRAAASRCRQGAGRGAWALVLLSSRWAGGTDCIILLSDIFFYISLVITTDSLRQLWSSRTLLYSVFSPWRSWSDTGWRHVRIVIDETALEQGFLSVWSVFHYCFILICHSPLRCAIALARQHIITSWGFNLWGIISDPAFGLLPSEGVTGSCGLW
jgi:hypothetical protein